MACDARGVGAARFLEETGERMVSVGMNYEVTPGKVKAFADGFKGLTLAREGVEGRVDSQIFGTRSVRAIISSFRSGPAARFRFMRSAAFKEATAWGEMKILAGRPRHRIFKTKENGDRLIFRWLAEAAIPTHSAIRSVQRLIEKANPLCYWIIRFPEKSQDWSELTNA
jgi:hypothetical protein